MEDRDQSLTQEASFKEILCFTKQNKCRHRLNPTFVIKEEKNQKGSQIWIKPRM